MKKPTEKRIKEYLKDIESNFTELMQLFGMSKKTWMIGHMILLDILKILSSEKELTFLFKDLPNRSNDDFFW